LIAAIKAAGSGDSDFFGFPAREEGLFLQQDPEEYADFVRYMASEVAPADLTLDIGIAAGGQTKFLRDYYEARRTIVVDDGTHPQFPHWQRIKRTVRTEIIAEIIDDSHSAKVRAQLLPYAGKIDVAFVDGDHSYRGLRKDIVLTAELLKVGGVMILHDTAAVGDVHRVFEDLLFSKRFVLVRNFQIRFGISLWRLTRRWAPTSIQRWLGHI